MDNRLPNDEMLMAYADGQLDAGQRQDVEAAMQRDPAIAARVEGFRQTARRLAALSAAQDDRISDDLIARVRALAASSTATPGPGPVAPLPPAPVIDLSDRRRATGEAASRAEGRRVPLWQLPIAASICLAIGLWAGTSLGPDLSAEPDGAQLAVLDSDLLHQALRRTPSGQRSALDGGGEVSVIASFLNADGQLCREFELGWPDRPTVVSVACHAPAVEPDGWSMQLAILAAPANDDGYAPASSLDTLDAYLGAIGAGPPLSEGDEATALAALD